MNSETALLAARQVSVAYGSANVLREVSFVVTGGSITSIAGHSGSGKTTLLSLLALLQRPTAGEILVRGRAAGALTEAERSRLRNQFYGTVFQGAHLIGSLSVLDNVLVPALLGGRSRAARPRARELLARLGLAGQAGYLPHMLSVGQRRRVAFARALLLNPAVVLADEPTNDLDPERAGQIADFLFDLPREGYAVVLVTHDRELARRAPRRYLLSQGRLREDAAPAA
jgi:ABC-type lipoprotein export system ATPase subunit